MRTEIRTTMQEYFDELWPLNRSITGEDYRKSLATLSELVPVNYIDIPSGTNCHNWIIPDEWNCRNGWITTPDEEHICPFSVNNLHVVGYSTPVNMEISWQDLQEHIHTVPELPNAIPYITSYYKKTWGFCMPHNQLLAMQKYYSAGDLFHAYIDSDLGPGSIRLGEAILKGKSSREILLSTYLCHPSMANNELSGPLVWAMVYKELLKYNLQHTIRFYIGPENIGAVAYLAHNSNQYWEGKELTIGAILLNRLDAGLVINCVGLGPEYTYKRSRQGDTLIDLAAWNVLGPWKDSIDDGFLDFFPDGSDERQYCSPGYNLPVGVFMRKPYWGYPEYHTSADNKLDWDVMEESVQTVVDIVLTADRGNEVWLGTVQMGTPQFSQCKEDIYESTMELNSFNRPNFNRKVLLDLCNYCDGEHTLLEIAERCGHKLLDMLPMVERLNYLDYLRRKQ